MSIKQLLSNLELLTNMAATIGVNGNHWLAIQVANELVCLAAKHTEDQECWRSLIEAWAYAQDEEWDMAHVSLCEALGIESDVPILLF